MVNTGWPPFLYPITDLNVFQNVCVANIIEQKAIKRINDLMYFLQKSIF